MEMLDGSKRIIPFEDTITLKDIEKALLDVGFRNDIPGFIAMSSSFKKEMYEEAMKSMKKIKRRISRKCYC